MQEEGNTEFNRNVSDALQGQGGFEERNFEQGVLPCVLDSQHMGDHPTSHLWLSPTGFSEQSPVSLLSTL